MIEEHADGTLFNVRPHTTDHNTINACSTADEYGLKDVDVEGKLVFDIGAHVGGVGVWLAKRGANVILVEPVPENAQAIREHIELNGVEAVVVEAAIGADVVFVGPENDEHRFIANTTGTSEAPTGIRVARVTFDGLVKKYGEPDIVKLDCEGGEWEVLRSNSIHCVPLIVGEYHTQWKNEKGECWTADDIPGLLCHHAVTVGPRDFGPFRAVRDR